MVTLDQQLVQRAYACITDRQSSHEIRELVFSYMVAVELHNHQWGRHKIYQDHHERDLRDFVVRRMRAQNRLNKRENKAKVVGL